MPNQETETGYDFWGAAPESMAISATGIFVFVESNDSEIDPGSLATLGKARELAGALGTGIAAVLLNSSNENFGRTLIHSGADKVFLAKNDRFKEFETKAYTDQIFALVQKHQPEILLAVLSDVTRDFFPRLAQRIPTGLVSGCTQLEIDTLERSLLATHPILGGKMFEVVTWKQARPQMALLQSGIFPPPISDEFRIGEIEKI